MGHQTENESSSGGESAPTPPLAEPAVSFGGDEAPYVPRVFAFDPAVKAELRDPEEAQAAVAPEPEMVAPQPHPALPSREPKPDSRHEAPEAPVQSDAGAGEPADGAAPAAVVPSAAEQTAPARRSVLTSIRANAAEPPPVVSDTGPTPVADAWERPATTPAPRVLVAATAVLPVVLPAVAPLSEATQVLPPVASPEPVAVRLSQVSDSTVPGPAGSGQVPQGNSPGGAVLPDAAPAGDDPGSPLDGLVGEEEHKRGWVRGLAWTGAAVVVLGGLYAGAQWYYADKVPHDTTVAGVEIGGLTTEAAVAALDEQLGTKAKEPITVSAGEMSATLDAVAAGLTFDAQASVDGLTSFSLSPLTLWAHIAGGDEVDPVVSVDTTKLDAQVEALAADLEVAPIDGSVQFVDGAPAATPAVAGLGVDVAAAPDEIVAGWLRTTPIALSTQAVEPAITQDETDAALASAQAVISGPVTVTVGGQAAELPPQALAAAALFTPTDGALVLSFNTDRLTQEVVNRTTNLLTVPEDAHFEFVSGAPQIVGGEAGTTLDPTTLNAAVVTAATGTDRAAAVELVETDPAQSVQVLQGMGIVEKVSEFSTPLTSEPVRTKNIALGASRLNGQLVKPGETLSLSDTIGPISAANGYFSAGTIQSGKHVDGIGGGLSQLSTTLYNASYFAGVELTEHQPHSRYFTRYPAGREATLFEGQIDNKFTNDTPYGILVQAWVADGKVHVAFWSTKHYTVETSDSGRSNVVGATVTPDTSPDCTPMGAGQPGFSITHYREVYAPDGSLVKDEKWPWTYAPDNGVSCGG